ncbi:Polyribonucleotide nucleotidyltransferase [Frankliniella fusca]|uniref:Polyribonucleotide nucleotidyltransferase n=1 Tax=Frankliniella fusca TaxID=407009 RepID=A0AAE1LTY0_9NEOP|nr:Polyribonucleotide nucleotidyltransferase [Frankliniella fusca]
MSIPHELPDNHNIKAMLRTHQSTTSASFVHVWCVHCKKPAEEKCVCEKHKIASRKSVLFEQLLQKLKLQENPLHPKNCKKFVESLTEAETEQALQMIKGQTAPTNILMREGVRARWLADLSPKKCGEDNEDAKLLQSILFLMRKEGIVSKDVLMPPEDKKPEEKPTVDPESILDLTNLSSHGDQTKVNAEREELLLGDQLLKTKRLHGLYCNRDKTWALKLLQSLAPVLVEVHLYDFGFEHLQAILAMPELRWLVLELTNPIPQKFGELPPLNHVSRVEFLWLNMITNKPSQYKQVMKQIIKLYESSLQTLFVPLPSYHTDAISYFDDFELPNLQVLLYGSSYCGDDNCHQVMIGLRKKFPGRKIVCMTCERMDHFYD